jgi:PAS domain S-box-containing protein
VTTLEGEPVEPKDWPLSRVLRGESLQDVELRLRRIHEDWERVFVYGGTPVRDAAGNENVFLTIRDITVRKRAEEELRLMHARFSTVFHSGPVAMSINVVADGRLIDVNDQYCKLLGFQREELIGRSVLEFNIWASPEERAPLMKRLLRDGAVRNFEVRQRRKSGEVRDVLASLELIELATEDEPVLISMFTDITERRVFEEQLKTSLKEIGDLKTALDEHAIVAITDPQGKITYVNDKFCAISKYSREELIGQDHRIVNSGFHSKEFIRSLWRTIAQGNVWHGEIKNKAKDGTFYWVDTTLVPFLDESGKPRQYVAIRADITGLKDAEEAIRTQAEDLARSNKDLEQFAYVASHDLQEPLRAVAGCLQVLQRRYGSSLDERADELIGHAVDGSHRMQTLIEGLLEFSRIGTRGGELLSLNCDEAFDCALKNLATSIEETGAVINRDPLPTISGDLTQITMLFQNLIGNAIKFRGDRPPQVHVSAERSDSHWIVSVRDEGIGIDAQYAERIFVIFQRLHTRKEYPGTGIGLALCKKIMERHGGTISVESTPGHGSTFRCAFPV